MSAAHHAERMEISSALITPGICQEFSVLYQKTTCWKQSLKLLDYIKEKIIIKKERRKKILYLFCDDITHLLLFSFFLPSLIAVDYLYRSFCKEWLKESEKTAHISKFYLKINKCLRISRDYETSFYQLEWCHGDVPRTPDIHVPAQVRLSAYTGKQFVSVDSLPVLQKPNLLLCSISPLSIYIWVVRNAKIRRSWHNLLLFFS